MSSIRTFPRRVSKPMTAHDICAQLKNGKVVSGDDAALVRYVSNPEEADSESLVFLRGEGSELLRAIQDTSAGVVIVQEQAESGPEKCVIFTSDSLNFFIDAVALLFDKPEVPTISESARVSKSAQLGSGVSVGPFTVIESGCVISDGARVGANCFIGHGTYVGERVFIQNNTTVSSVGLGYHTTASGEREFFPHLGNVILEPDVVVGSNCTIVRGQLNDTRIGRGARIGNLVNVGHNVTIGAETAVSSSCSIAGGVTIGSRCTLAVGVTVNAKIKIGDGSIAGLGSVITKPIPEGKRFFGNPARPLPTMRKF